MVEYRLFPSWAHGFRDAQLLERGSYDTSLAIAKTRIKNSKHSSYWTRSFYTVTKSKNLSLPYNLGTVYIQLFIIHLFKWQVFWIAFDLCWNPVVHTCAWVYDWAVRSGLDYFVSLKSGDTGLLCSLFQITLALPWPLHFHLDFRNSRSISKTKSLLEFWVTWYNCCAGVHCGICKSSYNISNIS
jgi:hypothetical protein